MCNRVGQESEMNFSGESIVVNQNGEAIKKASDQEEINMLILICLTPRK